MNRLTAMLTVILVTLTCAIYTIAIAVSIYGGLSGFTALIASLSFSIFLIISLVATGLIFMKPKNTLDL